MVNKEIKSFLRLVFSHAVNSVKPRQLLNSQLTLDKNKLLINSDSYYVENNCFIVGFGKAVYGMACVVNDIMGEHIQKGILSIPEGSLDSKTSLDLNERVFTIFQGAKNNIPDESSYQASKEILKLAKSLTEKHILLVLISGGGSALLSHPIPAISLNEKITVTKMLAHAGASINEMNIVRKQLSSVKGGKLAEIAYPCQVISLILSDVINDLPGTIASGPTIRNEDKEKTGIKILEKYSLLKKVPLNVLNALNDFKNEHTCEIFKKSNIYVIGNNMKALDAGKSFIESMNKACEVLTNELQGNVIDVANDLFQLSTMICSFLQSHITRNDFTSKMLVLSSLAIPARAVENITTILESENEVFLLLGGETTVKVRGKGKGGRNMELALLFSKNISNVDQSCVLKDFEITLLSAGTDGIDGPTDSAGAISYQGQAEIAKDQGLIMDKYLIENDSYNYFKFFNKGKDLITIGHTGTNVMDLIILHIKKND